MPAKKILIVDDEQELVKAIQIRLSQAGYEVIIASNGEDGVKKSKDENPDLIILDIMMPKMDGYTTLKKLQIEYFNNKKPLPAVIVLTAKEKMQDLFAIEGVKDYVVKPFEYQDLLNRVTRLLKTDESSIGMTNKRILIIDDEQELVKALEARLKSKNYEVLVAYNGEEGLQKARQYKPNLIILDIMMPKGDGYAVLIALKELRSCDESFPEIPVIVLTAITDSRKRELVSSENIVQYMTKPFDSGELINKVKELLG